MKTQLHKLFLAMVMVIFTSSVAFADHLSDELMISSKLTGDQEVPAVDTDAVGVASFLLNSTMDTMCVTISVNNLSGPLMGIHVHEGAAGENGPVLTDLTPFVDGNRIFTILTGADLTQEMVSAYLSGSYYLNVHTGANPNGEIRGQLRVESDYPFRANLDSEQQTADLVTDAFGVGYFNLSHNNKELKLRVTTEGLSGPIAGAHLHIGAPDMDGPVAIDLTSLIVGNNIMGTVNTDMLTDFISSLGEGNVYINIHTTVNPDGEIRGQLLMDENLAFDSALDASQEVTPSASLAMGTAFFSVSTTLDELSFEVQTEGLTGEITGAHLHLGAVGAEGDVVVSLTDDIDGPKISGTIMDATTISSVLSAMLSGGIYINIHTEANPGGEIRGQVYRVAREAYAFKLEADQEVPSQFAVANGSGLVSVDRDQSNAHFMMIVNDLTGPLTGAHFHNAPMGDSGPVLFNLTPFFDGMDSSDAAFGYWDGADDPAFDSATSFEFRENNIYVNVHTEQRPSGEVRGQVLRRAECFSYLSYDAGEVPFDPMFTTNMLFSSKLTGDQEVPAVDTEALGVAGLALNPSRDTLWVSVNSDGLSGPITGIHIHEGVAGENGDVVFNLTDDLTLNQVYGFITDFDLGGLIRSEYYVNVHTDANPGGEIRGQISFERTHTYVADLNGDQEVPSLEVGGFGLGVFNLAADGSELEIDVTSTSLTGAITGAHLHLGAVGSNGDVVVDLTPFLEGNSIKASIDPTDILEDLKAGNIYINVHTEANAGGEIRGQLNFANALVLDAGLNNAQEGDEGEAAPGRGTCIVWFDEEIDAIMYDVVVDQISGAITGSHIHNAGIGEAGPVLIDLSSGIEGNRISGMISDETVLTQEIITEMLLGQTYLNVHTEAYPAGEVRGQLHRLAKDGYSYELCGEQEVPGLSLNGYGGGILAIDRNRTNAHVMVTNTALSGPISGAHIHTGGIGENGGVIYNLTPFIIENSLFTYLAIVEEDAASMLNGMNYINVHTDEFADGEIRGQIDNVRSCPAPSIVDSVSELNIGDLRMYPNPVKDQLTIRYSFKQAHRIEIRISDLVSNVVLSKTLNGLEGLEIIDFQKFSSGMYIVELITGKDKLTQTVVKQ